MPKASAVPAPDFECSEDDIEHIFKTGVEEGRAGLTQARENERGIEQHDVQSDGVKKKMDSLSTAALSMGDLFMNGKNESAMMRGSNDPTSFNSPIFYNGHFTWKISGVDRERKKALAYPSTPLLSPPWYTHPDGYKLCTHLYLNGNGTRVGSHISVFLSVMKGEYDQSLSWPLIGRMSFFLLDLDQKHFPIVQTLYSDRKSLSFQRPPPNSDMNIASGCPDFAPVSILENIKYVNDDEMFIKCIMDVHS